MKKEIDVVREYIRKTGEKRKRENGTGERRCEDFVSVEAFETFGQGR